MSKTTSATQLAPEQVLSTAAARSARFASANPAGLRLVARPRATDQSVLIEAFRAYHGALFRLALALLRSRALAEDVVQDTWLAAVDGLASFQGRSSLKTWIFRILFNRALTCLRDEARSVPVSELRDGDSAKVELDPESWRGDDPEKLLVRKNAIVRIQRVLQLLPPRQRAVVTLGLVDGLKSDEVCGILGVRESHRRVLLHRARSKLRRALQDHLTGAQMHASAPVKAALSPFPTEVSPIPTACSDPKSPGDWSGIDGTTSAQIVNHTGRCIARR